MKEKFFSKLIVDNNIIADRNKFSESLQEYLVNHWNDASISESEKAYTSQKLSELESDIASALPSSTANYIIVAVTNDDDENGTNLLTAYAAAKLLTPNGAALSATNRATVIVPPGVYKLSVQLDVDTEFVDIVSLTGNRDVYLTTNTIQIQADNVYIKGIDVGIQIFDVLDSLSNIIVEKCKGGNYSFGSWDIDGIASGTYIDCEGGQESFGWADASGTFIRCKSSGDSSFGGNNTASGVFVDCESKQNSFGGYGYASGTFINCRGDNKSFGGNLGAFLTGKLYFCILNDSAFQTPTGEGAIYGSVDSTGFKAEVLPGLPG